MFGAGYAPSNPGEARADLTLEQILDVVAGIAKIAGEGGYREPILGAALQALPPGKSADQRRPAEPIEPAAAADAALGRRAWEHTVVRRSTELRTMLPLGDRRKGL